MCSFNLPWSFCSEISFVLCLTLFAFSDEQKQAYIQKWKYPSKNLFMDNCVQQILL